MCASYNVIKPLFVIFINCWKPVQYRKISKEREKNALKNFQLKNSFSQCRNKVRKNTMYSNGNVCLFGRVRDQNAHVNVLWKQGVWDCVISHQFDRSCCLIPILSPTHWGRFLAGQQSGDTGSSCQEALDLIMAFSSHPCECWDSPGPLY